MVFGRYLAVNRSKRSSLVAGCLSVALSDASGHYDTTNVKDHVRFSDLAVFTLLVRKVMLG